MMTSRRHLLAAVGLASLLAACGGGGSSDAPWAEVSGSTAVTALKVTDTTVGTGATAASGNAVSVKYTVWLYDVRVANTQKGTQIDTGTFPFTLGKGQSIAGFDQGVTGMKVGGKRTVVVPASLAYGAAGQGAVPPNAALVFDLELLSVS
ncbi:FKBP-type peptidyl-prolyl cis-trans isomerase [Pelomonas sp. KK5]|uniref:FKBP-type peptidyl-prolyl cis-trans isomerase n=1 Tax=Pelomonas sp. KK5 TaxID=1855730 RepID=UPI001E5F48A5|nr:FKBP-type peptidyl-prolyl cis-trans isomerase [Pelomonas sp. KK5]